MRLYWLHSLAHYVFLRVRVMKKEDSTFRACMARLGGGDLGFEDRYGEPLYSYITFSSGASSDHGVGVDEQCYYNDEWYTTYKFDWKIRDGWLYIYYEDGYRFIIEYPSVSGRYFYGTTEDGFDIKLEWVDGRSARKK